MRSVTSVAPLGFRIPFREDRNNGEGKQVKALDHGALAHRPASEAAQQRNQHQQRHAHEQALSFKTVAPSGGGFLFRDVSRLSEARNRLRRQVVQFFKEFFIHHFEVEARFALHARF